MQIRGLELELSTSARKGLLSASSTSKQLFDRDRQFAHAHAGGVMGRRRDRGSNAGQADLADAPRSDFVDLFIRIIQKVDVDRWGVGVDRDDVIGQVAVD